MFDRRLLEDFDWVLLLTIIVISIIGFMAIYSASNSFSTEKQYFEKQIIWFFLGLGVMAVVTMIDYRIIERFALIMHFTIILLLILMFFFGIGGKGSDVQRWFKLGPFTPQPSEFAKITLVLCLAHFFSDSRRIGDLGLRDIIWPIVITLIPFILILKQPDLGTAGVLLLIFIPIIYLVGIRYKVILITTGLVVVSIPFVWALLFGDQNYYLKDSNTYNKIRSELIGKDHQPIKPYQLERIKSFLNPEKDPTGAGYQLTQSIIAVGSGQLWGKGYMEGTQVHLGFLPARHTDFIFSVFTEEWGFIGGVTLVGLYVFLILRCLLYIGKTKDRSGSVLTLGITIILAFQVIINISMVLGMFPIVGIPLPFMSYGGSAMISNMIGIGLILNVRMRRYDI